MAKNIFVLGAGASREPGGPLMSGFLDLAHDLGGYEIPKADYDLVFKAERALRAAYANANFDLRNVESLWAAFEMAELMGQLQGIEPDEVREALQGAT